MKREELYDLHYDLDQTLDSLNQQWAQEERASALRRISDEERERLEQVRNLCIARRRAQHPDLSEAELKAGVEETIAEMTDPDRYFLNTTPEEFRAKYGCDQAQQSNVALAKVRSGYQLTREESAMLPDFPQEYQEDEDFDADRADMDDDEMDFDFYAESFLFGHIGRLRLLRRKISGLELIPGDSRG